MTIKGKQLFVQRGENFTLDFVVQNPDGTPYRVPSTYKDTAVGKDCFIVITVASATYNEPKRYIENWYLPIDKLVDTTDLVSYNDTGIDLTWPTCILVRNNPNVEYLYYDADTKVIEPYEFRIRKFFSTDTTKKWVEKNYLYSINLVSGKLLRYALIKEYERLFVDISDLTADERDKNKLSDEVTIDEIYNRINNRLKGKFYDGTVLPEQYAGISVDYDFLKNINTNAILHQIDLSKVILAPTKLTVTSNLNGGLL